MRPLRNLACCAVALGLPVPGPAVSQMRDQEGAAAFARLEAACSARLEAEALRPLASRFPFSPRATPTPAMLASEEKPSARERAALRAYATIVEDCNRQWGEVYDRFTTPAHAANFRATALQRSILLVQLHNGPLSFGAYNRERVRQSEELLATMTRLHEAVASGNADAVQRVVDSAQKRHEEALRRQKELQQPKGNASRCQPIGIRPFVRRSSMIPVLRWRS